MHSVQIKGHQGSYALLLVLRPQTRRLMVNQADVVFDSYAMDDN